MIKKKKKLAKAAQTRPWTELCTVSFYQRQYSSGDSSPDHRREILLSTSPCLLKWEGSQCQTSNYQRWCHREIREWFEPIELKWRGTVSVDSIVATYEIHCILSNSVLEIVQIVSWKRTHPISDQSRYCLLPVSNKVSFQGICSSIFDANLVALLSPQCSEFSTFLTEHRNALGARQYPNPLQL